MAEGVTEETDMTVVMTTKEEERVSSEATEDAKVFGVDGLTMLLNPEEKLEERPIHSAVMENK